METTMRVFSFTANQHIQHKVSLPAVSVIAETESQAREIADQKYPSIRQSYGDERTNIVGVRKWGYVEWDRPFLHTHLTECSESPVKPGIVECIMEYGDDD